MTAPITYAESNVLAGKKVKPHPDGKPWAKCCTNPGDNLIGCQCFMKKPRFYTSRFGFLVKTMDSVKRLVTEKGRFFCVHRTTDDGFHRECAGWAAKITGNRP